MNFEEYYIECKVAVLAKAKGGFLPLDGGIVKLYYNRMLRIKDYGMFEPEGWEYVIDESPLYDLDEYKYYKPYEMYLVEAYRDDSRVKIPKDLEILEVYRTHVFRIDTNKTEKYLTRRLMK